MNYRPAAVLSVLLGLGLARGTAPGAPIVAVEACSSGADVDETTLVLR